MFQIVENSIKVYKGTNPEVDSYSVFWDNKKLTETSLVSQLQERNATDIYICGLAYDVCVGKFQIHVFFSNLRRIFSHYYYALNHFLLVSYVNVSQL
jgi:exosome complex component RRP4